ncbi:MAG: PD-(D/E)XK nuclease family protein, partial [Actinomycetota bacterium]|nr:PD-(D/E)XK nuclease family protein [Actinomycetota bacterium]
TGFQKNTITKKHISLDKYEKLLAENINKIPDSLYDAGNDGIYELNKLKDENKNLFKKNFFSLTEILTFLDCPVLYKYRYVINMPEHENEFADYGVKMHKFIEKMTSFCFKNVLNLKNKIDNKTNNHDSYLNRLIFDEDSIEEMRFKNYIYNFINGDILNFDLTNKILLEQLFYWKVNDSYLICKADRIDILNNGFIKLYDYKTSSGKNRDSHDKHILQLKSYIYGLSDLFDMDAEKIIGILFYLGDGMSKQVNVENSGKKDMENKISNTINEIRNQKFIKKHSRNCKKSCSYKNFCY